MITRFGRAVVARSVTPVARLLLRAGVPATAVTVVGGLLAVVAAAVLVPTGHTVAAAVTLGVLTVLDTLDGVLARMAGTDSPWGAFVDAATDRLVDGTILASIALYAHLHLPATERTLVVVAALVALVLDQLVPYVKARGQAEGFAVVGGIAQRADRLVLVLLGLFAHGLGAPAWVLAAVLVLVALVSAITVGQRVASVRRQARTGPGAGAGSGAGAVA